MKKETQQKDLLKTWKKKENKDSLLNQWKAKKNVQDVESSLNTIAKAPVEGVLNPSQGQQRLWFLQSLKPQNPFYNYAESYSLRGRLNHEHLKKSLELIINEQEILRSFYPLEGETILYKTIEHLDVEIVNFDFCGLSEKEKQKQVQAAIMKDARTSFDLQRAPLWCISLLKLSKEMHVLVVTLHHIITDKWSMEIFRDRLATHYLAFEKGETPLAEHLNVQYSDYAFDQKSKPIVTSQLEYWKKQLSQNMSVLDLPIDYLRPAELSFDGGHHVQEFSIEFSKKVLDFSREIEVTPYVLMLSVYYVFLYRLTDQTDIAIGSPISNRSESSLEKIIGFFNDTLVLRSQIDPSKSFIETVSDVREMSLAAFANKDVPFEVLVKEINQKRSQLSNPFFQVMFLYHSMKETPSFGSDLELIRQAPFDMKVSKFDLTLYVSDSKDIITTTFEYASDLFNIHTIERFQNQFRNLIESVISNQELLISEIPMFTKEEKQIFSSDYSKDKESFEAFSGIHHVIENIAKNYKNSAALTFGKAQINYKELDEKADHVAHIIHDKIKKENEIVGLCMNRSLDMIIGLLAILKAGCAYLPIDPEYPKDRIQFMLEDSEVTTIITESDLKSRFEHQSYELVDIKNTTGENYNVEKSLPKVQRNDRAYIIYTSGSSGKPKGVPITHDNIITSTQGRLNFYDSNPTSFLLMSSISFDSSKAGIFWTLCTGGNLILSEKNLEQDVAKLAQVIQTNNVSHTLWLPSLYQLVLKFVEPTELKSLTTVIVAGEACTTNLATSHFKKLPKALLYNEYGPTEASVWCIAHQVKPKDLEGPIPIGRPVAKAEIYLLNRRLNRVPVGSKGEIYIGGKGLSGSYLNRSDLADRSYVENPFVQNGVQKLYKTGDFGRYRKDGAIEFLGRADEQIKIRGFRIELDEIEAVLVKAPNISEVSAVVINQNNNPQLVGYITTLEGYSKDQTIASLKANLPKHMVPSLLVELDEFKKLPNGKIDKEYLKKIKHNRSVEQQQQSPSTATENKILKIWSEVLQNHEISINDNFFEIGGDSLMTIQVIALLRKEGMPISPNQLFEYQTIGSLAKFVDEKVTIEDEWDYLVPLRKSGTAKPLFCIHAGGGHVFFYNGITEHLSDDVPVYALQPSGVYGDKEIHTSVAAMAKDYLDRIRSIQANGPYNILVYCFSASVGIEMADILSKADEKINLIVMDTMTAPAILNTPKRLKIRMLTFVNRLLRSPYKTIKYAALIKFHIVQTRFKGKYEKDEESKELEQLRLNLMHLSQTYVWKPYSGKTSLILTKKDHSSLNKEIIRSWEEFSDTKLNIIHTKGTHFNLFEHPIVAHTAAAIEKCIII